MSTRDLLGIAISGITIGLIFIAVMCQPALDDAADQKAQALAEARMKARLFTKYPDPAIVRMSAPVGAKDAK